MSYIIGIPFKKAKGFWNAYLFFKKVVLFAYEKMAYPYSLSIFVKNSTRKSFFTNYVKKKV